MLHTALYDVLSDDRRTLAGKLPREAVAHAAAHRLLVELLPDKRADLDAAFESAMSSVVAGDTRSKAVAAGEKLALAVLAARSDDGFSADSPNDYRPVTAPGVFITPTLPSAYAVGKFKPFALERAEQFRPGPPPQLDGPIWARDYNETKAVGGASSTQRTPWQSETARFWVALDGVEAWNSVARSVFAAKPLSLTDSARLFMNLNVALMDSYIAVIEAKYHYGFWRPITAIRNGDIDGNAATERDPTWQPLVATPIFPEYPCAHCIVDEAAGAVLQSQYGDGPLPEFVLTTPRLPGVTRRYKSLRQVGEEVDNARIWAGVHFRNSAEVADDMGRRIGEYVLKTYRGAQH
jgi:hypothetical protein